MFVLATKEKGANKKNREERRVTFGTGREREREREVLGYSCTDPSLCHQKKTNYALTFQKSYVRNG